MGGGGGIDHLGFLQREQRGEDSNRSAAMVDVVESNRSMMVDVVESNRSAAAEEEREAETKAAEVAFRRERWRRQGEVYSRIDHLGFESNRSAAAEEKREVETKAAEVDFEEEEGGDSLYAAQTSRFRDTWISLYSRYFGHFEDTTKIPNMRFTYKKPDLYQSCAPSTTLQIFSIKVARIRGSLQWPLHVFGMVAVRDVVDHNRNMIFDCPRESCQILTQEVPYLKLTGPTRAVVLVDPVTFEVDLKVKGTTQAEDECLSFLAVRHINFTSLQSKLIENDYASKLSTLEFEIGHIVYSVEATIFVRVRTGSWPSGFRAQIAARTASIGKAEVILLDSGDDRVHVACDGSIRLSRCVASVEITGKLEVCVKAGRGEEIVVGKKKVFKPKKDGASHGTLGVGFCTLDITVAWSIVSVNM